jgi:hypothetical protein
MDGMRKTMPGMDPIWYLFGTLIAISVILGGYVVSRDQVAHVLSIPAPKAAEERSEFDSLSFQDSSLEALLESPDHDVSAGSSSEGKAAALTFLLKDTRQVIEPILESLGLTQGELRDRSEFPKQE